ncbi:MAG: L,D-transpeptidase family protein [Woeseiaceae bacterium]
MLLRPEKIAVGALLVNAAVASAGTYELPPEGIDVVGDIQIVTAAYEDTLIDIARRHGVGYEEIVRANPDVRIWVPGEGTQVTVPSRFVLPAVPREGVVLNLAEYRLYYFPQPEGDEPAVVMTYPISIGRQDWETPLGVTNVVSKVTNPTWYPPQSVRDEHAADGRPLGRIVPPGPDNPLGKHAMRLGLPGYLIHGTNRPAGVGMRVTHGCVRMFPEDIRYLFDFIGIDTPVRIINEPVKIGWHGEELVMEVHPILEKGAVETTDEPVREDEDANADIDSSVMAQEDAGDDGPDPAGPEKDALTYVTEQFVLATNERDGQLDWLLVEEIVRRADGMPAAVGKSIKNAAASAASD